MWSLGARAIEENAKDAIEVMLVEGVIRIYTGKIPDGVDRFRRVIAIGEAIGSENLTNLGRAWFSLVCYNEGKILEAGDLLVQATRFVGFSEPRTILRISTVAGLLCEYAGYEKAASSWLSAARIAVQNIGIPGVLSSVIYDMAVAAIDTSALRKMLGQLTSTEAAQLLLRVKSAVNYDSGAGVQVQSSLHWLALGMAFNIAENYLEAEKSLQIYLQTVPESRSADRICASVELAIAQAGRGGPCISSSLVSEIERGIGILIEPTERALALEVLAKNHERSGLLDASKRRRADALLEIGRRQEISHVLGLAIQENSLTFPPAKWIHQDLW
jgi:tetratricopeptide (TPR) repeat protein